MMTASKRARALLSNLNVLLGLVLLMLLALPGCQKVRKCTRGDPGCLEGPLNADDECAAGLVPRGNRCVEPSGGSSGCNCAADELCDEETKTCLPYCAPVDDLPSASPTPPSCTPVKTASNPNPPALSFDELCEATCLQNCVRAQAFCPGFTCNPATCDRAVARVRCIADCPGMDATCMANRCMERSAVACADFMCPSGTRNCQNITCSDTCTGNNNDGFCDDGDPSSATYSFCPYGRDCTDCGPRRGSTRPDRLALGEPCPEGQDVSCEGYNDDFLKTEAWCLRFSGAAGSAFRCVPDCTTEDGEGECPDGYECQAVKTSSGEPYRDATSNRTPGYACVPQICEP